MADKKTAFVLSCPFCGRKPSFLKKWYSWDNPTFIAYCLKCGTEKYSHTLDGCVKLWNKRYKGSKQGYTHTFSNEFDA
jgi:Restriction alleviation protein Lar